MHLPAPSFYTRIPLARYPVPLRKSGEEMLGSEWAVGSVSKKKGQKEGILSFLCLVVSCCLLKCRLFRLYCIIDSILVLLGDSSVVAGRAGVFEDSAAIRGNPDKTKVTQYICTIIG